MRQKYSRFFVEVAKGGNEGGPSMETRLTFGKATQNSLRLPRVSTSSQATSNQTPIAGALILNTPANVPDMTAARATFLKTRITRMMVYGAIIGKPRPDTRDRTAFTGVESTIPDAPASDPLNLYKVKWNLENNEDSLIQRERCRLSTSLHR